MDAQEFEFFMKLLEFKQANMLLIQDIASKWASVVWPMWTFIGIFLGFIVSIVVYHLFEEERPKNICTVVSAILGLLSVIFSVVWINYASASANSVLFHFFRI